MTMISARGLLFLGGAIALAACADAQPPPPGTSAGPGAPPLQQESRQMPGSANASAGTPAITGAATSGGQNRPSVTYTAPATNQGIAPGGVPTISGAQTSGGQNRPSVTYR
jgi:hypothetical protein